MYAQNNDERECSYIRGLVLSVTGCVRNGGEIGNVRNLV